MVVQWNERVYIADDGKWLVSGNRFLIASSWLVIDPEHQFGAFEARANSFRLVLSFENHLAADNCVKNPGVQYLSRRYFE